MKGARGEGNLGAMAVNNRRDVEEDGFLDGVVLGPHRGAGEGVDEKVEDDAPKALKFTMSVRP